VGSAVELAAAFEERDRAFSDVDLEVSPFDVADGRACVEWVLGVTHAGRRVVLHGITVAEFDGDRIASFRQYWDELELLDQLDPASEE